MREAGSPGASHKPSLPSGSCQPTSPLDPSGSGTLRTPLARRPPAEVGDRLGFLVR
jgi:hypothetical protein